MASNSRGGSPAACPGSGKAHPVSAAAPPAERTACANRAASAPVVGCAVAGSALITFTAAQR